MSSPHNISTATRIVSYLATEPVNGAAAAPKKEILDQRAERDWRATVVPSEVAPLAQHARIVTPAG
jgi:hypothetical protein